MFSFAKNDRGIRLASAAIIFLPVAALIGSMCRSDTIQTAVAIGWFVFAALALIAFLSEQAEKESQK